jgi:hypothetical protein
MSATTAYLIVFSLWVVAIAIVYGLDCPRLATEARLLRLGRWFENDGDPANKWAEEFDRRDKALTGSATP